MTNKEITLLLAPKGEWLASFLRAFEAANLMLTTASGSDRDYYYQFANQTLPIAFLAVRSAEVWANLKIANSKAVGGFTGSDQLLENKLNVDSSNWEFPLVQLDPRAPQPKLYLGLTPLAQNASGLSQLSGGSIYTSFRQITQQYLAEKGLTAQFKVRYRAGGTERLYENDQTNVAIIDISSSGTTGEVNKIRVVDILMKPKLVFIGKKKIPEKDQLRIDDLQEKLYQAAQKKGNG